MLSLLQLVIFIGLCLLAYLAWQSILTREFALEAVRRHCRQQHLQLLDDTVSLRALWFKRDRRGQLRFWCCFYFEFSSTGERRYRGKINVIGRQVLSIELEPHRPPEDLASP